MSGLFHCGKWTRQQEELLGNLDYFGIYLQIAFSIAPVFVLLMPTSAGWIVVSFLAAAAAAGGVFTFNGPELSRFVHVAVYTAMAAAQIVPLFIPLFGTPSVFAEMLPSERWLLLTTAVSYFSGSQIFAHAWPPLCKDAFGYHELWHLLIIVGSAATYSTNCSIAERISLNAGPEVMPVSS